MSDAKAERAQRAAELCDDLAPLGDVTVRSMFGGHGIFESSMMFAMVDSGGNVRFRCDDTTSQKFAEAGGERMGRMPYWDVPATVLNDPDQLVEWGAEALAVARAARRG